MMLPFNKFNADRAANAARLADHNATKNNDIFAAADRRWDNAAPRFMGLQSGALMKTPQRSGWWIVPAFVALGFALCCVLTVVLT